MVFTLTAAMLVGTPLTASAAGLVDLYHIEDGYGNVVGNDDVSRTGTVTATETNSGVLSVKGILQGIGLSETNVKINTDEIDSEKDYPDLTAYLEWEGEPDKDLEGELLKSLKWRSSNTQIVAVKVPNGSYDGGSRETIKLIPKASGTAKVTVSLDSSQHNLHYSATATITVVQYADTLTFEVPEEDKFSGNALVLDDYVETQVAGKPVETADEITYALLDDGNKAATLKNGILTLKKSTAENKPVKVKAMGKKESAQAVAEIKVQPGVNATKLTFGGKGIRGTALTWLANDGLETTVTATVTGKKSEKREDRAKPCTDKITWSSVKPEIVEVVSPERTVGFNDDKCPITLKFKSAGKTQVIGKTSAGKSFKLNVTVSAELTGVVLETGNVETNNGNGILYTGQIIDLNDMIELQRFEAGTDSKSFKAEGLVKWEFTDSRTMKSLAKLNAKTGVLEILPDLNKRGTPAEKKITVKAVNAKRSRNGNDFKVKTAGENEVTFELKQVSISKIFIAKGENTDIDDNGSGTFVSIVAGGRQNPKNANDPISVGREKTYRLKALGTIEGSKDEVDVTKALGWTASGNGKTVKATKDGSIGRLTAIKKGSATITASGVTKNERSGKYVAIKATFKSTVNAPTKTIKLSVKNTGIAVKYKSRTTTTAKQNITIRPVFDKGSTTKNKKNGDVTWTAYQNGKPMGTDAIESNGTGKLTLPEGKYAVGDKITVVAKVKNGPSTSITFTVVEPSKSVVFKTTPPNKVEFASADAQAQTVEAKVLLNDSNKTELTPGDKYAATVTYTMNKAGVVRIVENKKDGKLTIYPLTKGNVTITAKTSDGKTGKLNVKVK